LFDRALNAKERIFVEENIDLLHEFMKRYSLPQEHYGRLAIQFVRTAARYLQDSDLQQLSFSTVVWFRLRSELSHMLREDLKTPVIIPLEDCYLHPEHYDDYGSVLLYSVEQKLTPRQKQVLRLRIDGKSNIEIAEECGISRKAVEHLFARIRKRVGTFLIDGT